MAYCSPTPRTRARRQRSSVSDLLEAFTDSDCTGDESSEKKRRHSVSSAMLFLNGCLVAGWSRSQKAISLSSCEAEFLAAAEAVPEQARGQDSVNYRQHFLQSFHREIGRWSVETH